MEKRQLIEDSDEESHEPEDIARDYLRISIVLSFLTQKDLKIKLVDQIRPFEVSLLKLITKITDGTRTEVDKHLISLHPGRLVGGDFVYECDKSMPLSYYLEPLVLLLPFTSQSTTVTLKYYNLDTSVNNTTGSNTNITSNNLANNNNNNNQNHDRFNNTNVEEEDDNIYLNNEYYSSLECFCSVCTVILQMIGCEANFKFKEPHEVVFSCNPIRKIQPISLIKSPKIKRVRGSVLVRNLQPNLGKRAIIGAKRVLDVVCDNTWIALSSPPGRFKPILMVSLIAEGTKNCIFTSHSSFYYKSKDNSISNISSRNNNDSENDDNYYDKENLDSKNNKNNKLNKLNNNVKNNQNNKSSLKQILSLALNNHNNHTDKNDHNISNIDNHNNINSHSDNTNHNSNTNIEDNHKNEDSHYHNHNNHINNHINHIDNNNNDNNENKNEDHSFDNVFDECEKIGEKCAYRLCSEISLDSVIDTTHQHLLLFFMSLSGDHQVSKVRLAKLNRYSVYLMRLIRTYLGVTFKFEEIESESGNNVLLVKCIGSNFQNINIKSF